MGAMAAAYQDLYASDMHRAQFYFAFFDLDGNGTLDYDEIYAIVSSGQEAKVANAVIWSRRLWAPRTRNGMIKKSSLLKAAQRHRYCCMPL